MGDPTAVLSTQPVDTVHGSFLAATTFTARGKAPVRRTYFAANGVADNLGRQVPMDPADGFRLQQSRLALSGNVDDWLGVYAAVAADSDGLAEIESYGEISPLPGLSIRGGRWLLNTGAISGRRVDQRCFVDAPIHTQRFLGPDGLYDAGLRIRYQLPVFPVALQFGLLSGATSHSFGFPDPPPPTATLPASGDGGDVFDRLLYMLRLQIELGHLFDQSLWVGATFVSGHNGTGPGNEDAGLKGNRTDLIMADIGSRFVLGELRLGFDFELAMRRYSVPEALYVEGGFSTNLVAGWRALEGGLRLDLMGVPEAPDPIGGGAFRVTAMAGYRIDDLAVVRLQYAARNDNEEEETAHEVHLQAVLAIDRNLFGGHQPTVSSPTPPEPPTTPTPPKPIVSPAYDAEPAPESNDPKDWIATAIRDQGGARAAANDERHAPASFSAQQAAYKALFAVAREEGRPRPRRARRHGPGRAPHARRPRPAGGDRRGRPRVGPSLHAEPLSAGTGRHPGPLLRSSDQQPRPRTGRADRGLVGAHPEPADEDPTAGQSGADRKPESAAEGPDGRAGPENGRSARYEAGVITPIR